MGPQSRPVEFNAVVLARPRRRGIPLAGEPGGRPRAVRGVHFPRVERHDRFPGRHVGRRKVARAASWLVWVLQTPDLGRLWGPRTRRLARRARVGRGRIDWAGLLAVPSDRWPPLGVLLCRASRGLWRPRRHPTRPVLKHGPRSLTHARVTGLYETQRRNESEGGPSRAAQV